jgi:hypothetical protein
MRSRETSVKEQVLPSLVEATPLLGPQFSMKKDLTYFWGRLFAKLLSMVPAAHSSRGKGTQQESSHKHRTLEHSPLQKRTRPTSREMPSLGIIEWWTAFMVKVTRTPGRVTLKRLSLVYPAQTCQAAMLMTQTHR